MKIFVIAVCSLALSCSFKPYRATIGLSSNSSSFKTIDGEGDERALCVKSVSANVEESDKCDGGGYKTDKGVGYLDPWLEFTPAYFKKSRFGWSYFFAFNRSKATLSDYPFEGDETDVEIDRISLNPIVFYNFGDKMIDLDKNQDLAFRIGLGAALNYVSRFRLERRSTEEAFHAKTPFKPGLAAFLELSWKRFIFRVENSQVEYGGKKFKNVDSDTLRVENTKVSLLYSHYFKQDT